jgi:hypothetical protein
MKKAFLIVFLALAIGFFFGFLWGRGATPLSASLPSTPANYTAQPTASLMLDYGDGHVRTYADIATQNGETMIQLLEKQTKTAKIPFKVKKFDGLGTLVETIDTKTNGDEGKYWQYWVNNVAISYGADVYLVKPGDVIEWKFLHYK